MERAITVSLKSRPIDKFLTVNRNGGSRGEFRRINKLHTPVADTSRWVVFSEIPMDVAGTSSLIDTQYHSFDADAAER